MRFLVDANVLSEATRSAPDPRALDWLRTHEHDMVVNPIVLGELRYGILCLPAGRRRSRLLRWFAKGIDTLTVVPIDMETATTWAELLAELKKRGRAMPVKDSLIAASARQHGLTVATRNVRDYQHCGVRVIDPFGF